MSCYSLVTWDLQAVCRTKKITQKADTVSPCTVTLHISRERNLNGAKILEKKV